MKREEKDMSESNTNLLEKTDGSSGVVTEPLVSPEAPGGGKKKKNKRNKKVIKRVIAIVVAVAILGSIGFGMYKLFAGGDDEKQALTEFTYIGSIQSTITGSGVTRPKDSATLSALVSGVVEEVNVAEGDRVEVGDLIYVINSETADAEIAAAEEELATRQDSLEKLYQELEDILSDQSKLTITAPFSGKLIDCNINKDDFIAEGTVIGTLVNDSKMRLTQYFSYAYENDITTGMTAKVSIPSSMSTLSGTVESITKVQRVSPEGALLFEVVVVVDNPGTLTEGTLANAFVTTSSGEDVYAYEAAEMQYYEKRSIVAEVGGTCLSHNMKDYLPVSGGSVLASLSSDAFDDQIKAMNKQIETAEESLNEQLDVISEKNKELEKYRVTAPIAGNVMSCSFIVGEEVTAGSASVTIADTSIMYLEAQIDEMNVADVLVGMPVEISQYDGNVFYGEVSSVSMEGKYENGVSFFPAVITIENAGDLMSGMYCDYKMVASEISDCVIAPVQAVKYTEQGTCLFVKSDTQPENAITDLGEDVVPDGFYAVPVEVGLTDNYGAQIVSGVDAYVEVFTSYLIDEGSSW